MKDETAAVAIDEFFWINANSDGLMPKVYSDLVDDNSEHKKARSVNRNVVATISHNECKDHKIGTYEINKISLSCFNDKI